MLSNVQIRGIALAIAVLALGGHATAAVVDNQSLPDPGWFNGTGQPNGAFTVDTEDNGIEIALRAQLRTVGPVTPVGNTYFVPTGTMSSSFGPVALWDFDFSVNPGTSSGLTSLMTITNLANGNFLTFDPSGISDNAKNGVIFQNSENLSFSQGLGFDPNLNGEFQVVLNLSNSDGDVANVSEFIVIGSGVPEPSTWAMMIVGFGFISFAAFRRGRSARSSYA